MLFSEKGAETIGTNIFSGSIYGVDTNEHGMDVKAISPRPVWLNVVVGQDT
ncbi:BnaUnng04620D [Brassica napus]|uniref:BnaUnng04620D protein n=1 Tax=Brassica napus TaxID=3708 RepID=A0A078JW28_BRANA|nr:BnaUnng04620D [Brassica napus]